MTLHLSPKSDQLLQRFAALAEELASGAYDAGQFAASSKEYAALEPVAQAIRDLRRLDDEAGAVAEIIDTSEDGELIELAREEQAELTARQRELTLQLKRLLLPKDAADERNVIMEVRAGTGGNEAALFAGDLFRMYERYAASRRWRVEVLSANDAEYGGYKEIIAGISGAGVFARLKFESGVHRVQRVPETETQGRVHTSAATVAVLPEAEDVDITLEDKDLRIDVFRASGPGGQSVNTTDSAVRVTHLPTGVTVIQQDEKSQHKNKAKALKVLRARLFDRERARMEAERARERRDQVGSGDRSQRIRTYNFPQGRVTDHRINLTLYKLEQIIAGEALDELIEALVADHQTALLSAQDG